MNVEQIEKVQGNEWQEWQPNDKILFTVWLLLQ